MPGIGRSIAGQRNLNGAVVDGLSANDDAADLAGTFFSQEVIRELAVITSAGIAEFGRTSSGIVNILAGSGANRRQGSAHGFLRNRRLDAGNTFAAGKGPLTQAQCGVSLGGPIRRDRAFFFSNLEQEHLNRANLQFPNNIFGAGGTPVASLGKATAAADPRQFRFGCV